MKTYGSTYREGPNAIGLVVLAGFIMWIVVIALVISAVFL